MSQTLDLRELERKTWRSTFQDGLWDIYLGLLLAASAVGAWLSNVGAPDSTRIPAYVSVMLLGGLALWAGKKFITTPRLGRVEFGPQRKARQHRLRLGILVAVLLVWALFVAGLGNENGWFRWPEWLNTEMVGSAIIALLLLLVFSMMAYFMEFKRLYLYAVLFTLQEVVGVALRELAGVDSGSVVGAAVGAAIMLLIGTVVFIRFLRAYPVPADERLSTTTSERIGHVSNG